jgi:hypothetical protein
MGSHKRELVMGDQRRRSRSGYITGYWSPLGVDKSEDASPINRPLGYEPSQDCLTRLDWTYSSCLELLPAPCVVRSVSADSRDPASSRYRRRYQSTTGAGPRRRCRKRVSVTSGLPRPRAVKGDGEILTRSTSSGWRLRATPCRAAHLR